MGSHRTSYWKTVIAAGLSVAIGLLLVVWVATSFVIRYTRDASPAASDLLLGGLIVLVVGVPCALAALVAVGGLICLRRDALEVAGTPYVRKSDARRNVAPRPSWIRRVMRRVLRRKRQDGRLGLRPGDLVEVRSWEDIRRTLDDNATLDGLPFMPEMHAWCGRQARVVRRVEKIHDWVWHTGLRRLRDVVHLEGVRCDGSGHGGCQARCHVLWKEAWLRRSTSEAESASVSGTGPPELLVRKASADAKEGKTRYVCQATELTRATTPLSWGDPRHYLRDLLHGSASIRSWVTGVSVGLFNAVQRRRRGAGYPQIDTLNERTSPSQDLQLTVGELVTVKSKQEIEQTLGANRRNRGLWFDADMIRFCGGTFRVLARVDRLVDEKTGELVHLKTPCILLEGVTATGEYLGLCPQNEYIFWREIWLRRSPDGSATPAASG